jgi:hypothetical protein
MHRFSSLQHAPGETRVLLRGRYRRHLRVYHGPRLWPDGDRLPDELMLRLLRAVEIAHGADVDTARRTYDAERQEAEPEFDTLIAVGWLAVSWGRVWAPRDYFLALRNTKDMPALAGLLTRRHNQAFLFRDTVAAGPDIGPLATDIEAGRKDLHHMLCRSPSWIAARLWDGRTKVELSRDLRNWTDRWQLLGEPELVCWQALNEVDAEEFRSATLAVVANEAGFSVWTNFEEAVLRRLSLPHGQPATSYSNYAGKMPTTMVGRALWLRQPRLEALAYEMLEADPQGPIRLLWLEVAHQELGTGPAARAVVLLELAIKHPELLVALSFQVQQHPQLLADVALFPPTTALACLWIAQWQAPSGGWDRSLNDADDRHGKAVAFTDAVSLLGEFLELGKADPAEAAALLKWCHDNSDGGFVDDAAGADTILAALRDIVARQSGEIARTILAALVHDIPTDPAIGSGAFAAALDVISLCHLEDSGDPSALIAAYIASFRENTYRLDARRIGLSSAAALYRLSEKAAGGANSFLYPIDVPSWLARAAAENTNPYTLVDDIGRALRAHIRILCRAIAGLGTEIPYGLVDALVHTVTIGALDDTVNGRVGAFAPRFEVSPSGRTERDRAIAADLAMVLPLLPEPQRQRMLQAVLGTNEPLILAQLHQIVSVPDQKAIAARINQITPGTAAELRSYVEVQARINALLNANLAQAAARFIDAEADVRTFGKVGGREEEQARWKLRLLYASKDWDAILATPDPPAGAGVDPRAARDSVRFFKAIAILSKPVGDPEAAASMFRELFQRNNLPAYASNVFASEVAAVLKDNSYGQLTGAQERRARDALVEVDTMIAQCRAIGQDEQDTIALNKALLYLGLKDADKALALLDTFNNAERNDKVAAYRALALAQQGHVGEANAALAEAHDVFGDTPILRDVEVFLGAGVLPHGPTVALILDASTRQHIKVSLFDLMRLDPTAQAEILSPKPEPLDAVIIDVVRDASAALTGLMPMFPDAVEKQSEDDYSAVLRELIRAQVNTFLGWSTRDQSKAGYSAKGNPGEPDILLQKGGSTLAAIEAVICDQPVRRKSVRQDLTRHFTKLFTYSTGTLYFHVTYVFAEDLEPICTYLSRCAHAPPPGITYDRQERLVMSGTLPLGFVARYRREAEELKVVFLILNMGQARQKAAAKMAGATKAKGPTKKKKPRGSKAPPSTSTAQK